MSKSVFFNKSVISGIIFSIFTIFASCRVESLFINSINYRLYVWRLRVLALYVHLVFKIVKKLNNLEAALQMYYYKNKFWKYTVNLQETTHVKAQLYWNLTSLWMFSCKLAAFFQNTFFLEHLWKTAIDNCNLLYVLFESFLWKSFLPGILATFSRLVLE